MAHAPPTPARTITASVLSVHPLRRVGWLVVLVGCLLTCTSAHADNPIPLVEYRRIVAQTVTLIEQASAQPAGAARQARLMEAATLLASAREVQLASGVVTSLNNDTLIAQLRDPATNLESLRNRLRALQTALDEPPAVVSGDDLTKLHDILNRPPFKEPESDSALLQWLARILQAINDLLARLVGNTAVGIYDARDLIVLLGVLLIVAVLGYFALSLRRNTVAEVSLKADSPLDEANLTSSAALDNAQQFASAGDYRSAVRQLYLSTLLFLDERGRLRYDRSLTNREYLRAVASTPSLREALRPLVETFDRIWYGFAPISAHEFEAYRRDVEAIREM